MRLQMLSRRPFYGRIYTYRHYDSCSVVGRGSRELSLFIPAHGCGTQMVGTVQVQTFISFFVNV